MDNKKEKKERSKEKTKEGIKKNNARKRNVGEGENTKTTFGYWEVQIKLTNNWQNCISDYVPEADGSNTFVPKTYDHEFQAHKALQNRLKDEATAFKAGDAGYNATASQYRLSFIPAYK